MTYNRDGNAKPDSIQMGFLGKQKRHFGQFCSVRHLKLHWYFSMILLVKFFLASNGSFTQLSEDVNVQFSIIIWVAPNSWHYPKGECSESVYCHLPQIVDLRTATFLCKKDPL